MQDIINANIVEFILLIGYLVLIRTGDIFNRRNEKLLNLSALVIFLMILTDICDSYFDTLESINKLRYLTSALGYTLRPIALSLFITILAREGKSLLHIWIPVVFIAVIALTSYWTHLMFYFTDDNEFIRGSLGYLPHIMAFAYMGVLAYYSITRYRIIDKGEVISMIYSILACFTAVMLETFLSMKFILTGAILSSCIVYYTFLSSQVYKIDPLTGAYNRISFDKDAERKANKCLDIINVDLNNLKIINDTKGHIAGDKALSTLSSILLTEAGNNYRVYRVGGDEFFVIGYSKQHLSSEKFIGKVRSNLENAGYTASFGYSSYKPGQDFAKCCVEADRKMYEDKKRKKQV